jgi:hypothetical protein
MGLAHAAVHFEGAQVDLVFYKIGTFSRIGLNGGTFSHILLKQNDLEVQRGLLCGSRRMVIGAKMRFVKNIYCKQNLCVFNFFGLVD